MIEYFHIYVNGGLTYVGLVLSQAVQVMDKLKADGNEPVMKSYMLDPAVLEAMSQSYDNERLANHFKIIRKERLLKFSNETFDTHEEAEARLAELLAT